jgi:hypothetical protein
MKRGHPKKKKKNSERMIKAATFVFLFAVSASAAGAPTKPRAEWARAPEAEPARLGADGKLVLDGATGGATGGETGGATGLDVPDPVAQAAEKHDCADCGVAQDTVEEDGSNPRPIVKEAHVVLHADGGSAFNATGDYSGQGTLAAPGATAPAEKCCRVCPPAEECKDKDGCFQKCKRVCGPTCHIPAPPKKCGEAEDEEPCAEAEGEAAAAPQEITPAMVKSVAATPDAHKVAAIGALLRGNKNTACVDCENEKREKEEGGAVVENEAVGTD